MKKTTSKILNNKLWVLKKNYNIEKVQYEKEIDWKNKWKKFKKTSQEN